MNNVIKGKAGEDISCDFLKKKGYEILARNFRTSLGEIDIVAVSDDCLVFIEVKSRKDNDYGMPSEAVGYKKQEKISRVAAQFISKYKYFDAQVRFDVIEVNLFDSSINHIENAFDSYLRY